MQLLGKLFFLLYFFLTELPGAIEGTERCETSLKLDQLSQGTAEWKHAHAQAVC